MKEEAKEELQLQKQRFPLQPVVRIMLGQAVPLQPRGVNSGADLHLQSTEDLMPEQLGCLKEVVTPQQTCNEAGSWQNLKCCGGAVLEQCGS